MANKAFEIQGTALSIGGVDLNTSVDGKVVIPGVTRATAYQVKEVEDTGDQTLWFETPPDIIDHVTWNTYNANGGLNGAGPFASYSAELDGEGYIDNINVAVNGTYTSQESTFNESHNMWIYTANAPDKFSPFVGTDWTQIPFRPRMQAGGIESEFGGGGSGNQLVSNDQSSTFALMDEGDVVFDGEGPGGVNRGLVWQFGDNNDGINSMVRQDSSGLTVRAYTMNTEGRYSAPVNISTNQDQDQKTWTFDGDGALTFPDGSVQTTAYTGQSSGSSSGNAYYVVANNDGTLSKSTDGINWTAGYDAGDGVYKVSTDGTTIAAIVNSQLVWTPFVGTNSWTFVNSGNPDQVEGYNVNWQQIDYSGGYFIAVGNISVNALLQGVYGYSTDGRSWTLSSVDITAQEYFGLNPATQSWQFTDVDYNGVGWNFAVAGDTGGGVYVTDITAPITSAECFGMEAGQQAAWSGTAWFYYNPNAGSGIAVSTDPRNVMWNGPINPWTSSSVDVGLMLGGESSDTMTGGNGYLAISDGGGHVAWSGNNGQDWHVAVPIPYTSAITDISVDGGIATVTFTGSGYQAIGEKITISGSSVAGYNGTFYINDSRVLYTDNTLTTTFDASALDPFTSPATLTWSHGTYIDSMDYVNGWFYIGNDDEQIARTQDFITWTIVDDQSSSDFNYWNDIAGYVSGGPTSKLTNGEYTFTLNRDGTISAPTLTVNLHNGGNQEGQVLQFGETGKQAIITGPTPATGNSAERLIIQGQNGGTGEGGDVYLWAGDAQSNGGDIKIYAGDADAGQNAYGGYINIEGGSGYDEGGDVTIRGGSSATNPGQFYVYTNQGISNKQWLFDNAGRIVLPADGDIVDNNGVSVLGGGGAELRGDGYASSTGVKRVVYANYQGSQYGGENTSALVNGSDVVGIQVGDTITFRNGEIRTITTFDTNYDPQVLIYWDSNVDNNWDNPHYPMTITSSNYAEETKPSARIKPDVDTEYSGQYMDIYVGGAMVKDNKHVHMAGHSADTELFLGTDSNFVSSKDAGASPARVNLKSENDITVSDTNLRMTRGNTWLSLYGDGENRNQHGNTYDLTWNVIETDDQGNLYVGGESCAYAEAMIAKYGPDGDLLWTKLVNGDDISGWQLDGVAYNPNLKEVAVAVQSNNNRDYDYYKINTFDSETGNLKTTFDLYDPDGHVNINNMTWHPTLGYVAVGYTQGEKITSGPITGVSTQLSVSLITATTYPGTFNLQEAVGIRLEGDHTDKVGYTISGAGLTGDMAIVYTDTLDPGSSGEPPTPPNTTVYVVANWGSIELQWGTTYTLTDRNIGIIELPVAAVKVGGNWPDRNSGTWTISGTNITGNQVFQGGGPGLYQNVPVMNLTNPTDTGLTVGIRVDYASSYYDYYTTNSSGTGVWAFNDNFKILGSNLGGIDGGTNVSGTVDTMTQASANAYAFFTKVDHPNLYDQLNACSWTAQFNTNTYNVISCVENGAYWAVLLQDCTDLSPSSILFYTANGNDINGLVADLNGIQNGFTGTPNVNGLYHIDMGYQMGYGGTDFTGGTFTITALAGNRAFVWTNSWSKIYKPINSAQGTNADCVTVQKSTGDIFVGARDNTNYRGFVWKLDNTGATVWINGLNNDTNRINSIAVSEITGEVYYSTSYNSINKLNSLGNLMIRTEPRGMWGHDDPIIKLEQSLDGVEYLYVASNFGAVWTNQSGFLVSKLTNDLKLVWSRDFWNEYQSLNIHYDVFHNNIVLGRDKIVMAGSTYVNSPNNSNAYLASISTSDQFDPVQIGAWHVETVGLQYQDYTGDYTTYDFIDAGGSTDNSTLLTDTEGNVLTWTNWAWKSTVLRLDKEKSITGVESIHFAEGGNLDHNPSDIPPVFTDYNSEGWNYLLKLSDRGKFIMNGQMIENYTGNLYLTVPSNIDTNFPVGSVITLINVSDSGGSSNRIYVQPENYGNSYSPRIYASGFGSTYSTWSFQGVQTATLMKIGSNEWLLTANDIQNED